MSGEMNFFLQDDNLDLKTKEGEGYDESEAANPIDDQDEQPMISAQDLELRQKRYEKECAMGYFL